MEYVDVDTGARDPNKNFPTQIANGQLVLHNVFSQPLKTYSPATAVTESEGVSDPIYLGEII